MMPAHKPHKQANKPQLVMQYHYCYSRDAKRYIGEVNVTIGENLRRLRKERRLSQPGLAKRAGVPQPTISNIENDRREPHASTLRKLADALGVEVVDFFRAEEARPLVPMLPRTPLANSSPEALETRLFGAPVEAGAEPVMVMTEPEARELSDALLREQLALVGWIEAYAAAPDAERFDRRADHDRAQALQKRATAYHNWVFSQWRKLYDPQRSAVPFKGARQWAAETDEAVGRFMAIGQAEAERKRIEQSGDAV
jgi:transcriptional regulator with XRE-family HTH domain